jgi:hypothetical protein
MGISPDEAKARIDQAEKEAGAGKPLTIAEIEICQKLGLLPIEYLLQRKEDALK